MNDMILKELEEQESELMGKLLAVRKSIREERERLVKVEFGVFVGAVVLDRKCTEHKVTRVDVRHKGKPWLEGNPKKKNGAFGVAVRNLYADWYLPNTP